MGLINWFKSALGVTFELKAEDIVVFMVGPSGGGKSWFIKAVTDSDHVKVGGDLKPCTTEVQALRCELTDEGRVALQASEKQKNIVFVDTPSLQNGDGDESKAEKNTSLWMKKSKSKSTLVGIIYVDRIVSVKFRATTTVQGYLDCFARTFPSTQDFTFPIPLRLRGVLNYNPNEDTIEEEQIVHRKGVFQRQLREVNSSLFYGRGKVKWHASTDPVCLQWDKQEAWNVVVALFSQRA